VTVTDGNGSRHPELSCFIATTPWSGSHVLCDALRASGLAGNPRDYFNPLGVVPRSVRWQLLGPRQDHLPRQPEREFAARYLTGVTEAATGPNGVLSVNLPWSHQRWLTRFARAAVPGAAGDPARSDAEIIESWYPRARYVYLTCADTAWQAGRWYLGRNVGPVAPGPGEPHGEAHPGRPADFQQVRWIETLISRQERAWETYFLVHGIDPQRITCEEFLAHPEETVRGILGLLGVAGSPARQWGGELSLAHLRRPVDWLADYAVVRDRLSPTIGVYGERG
jgi:trehalose 2-sulfotransferase